MNMGDILARIALKQRELGVSEQALSKNAGLSKDGIRNWRRRYESGDESAGANATSISKVAAALEVSELWLLYGMEDRQADTAIPIVGTVGAGAKVPVFEAYEPGDGPRVACPPGLPNGDLVAVEVEGISMEPLYFAGDLLFYRRDTHEGVPAEALGRICVCEDEDGMGWVKQVKLGSAPGLFNLIAANPIADNIHDVRLKWAAPVSLHWPAELVRKL